MRIDHMIIGANDAGVARDLLRSRYGFGLVDGSPNADGTASWVVPFDSPAVQYLEILVPHDERKLLDDDLFGRRFLARVADGMTFLNWAVLSDDIDDDAARIRALTGASPDLLQGESERADGKKSPWSEAAFMASWLRPSRPFFLTYGNWPARRARLPNDLRDANHDCVPLSVSRMRIRTTDPALAEWIGGTLPVDIQAGETDAVESVTIDCVGRSVEIVL